MLSLAVLLAVVGNAEASASGHDDEARIRLGGAVVWWPYAQHQTLAPGARVRVRVQGPKHGRGVRVELVLTDGRHRLVKVRRLRRGVFLARLSTAPGAAYLLRARTGSRVRVSRLTVADPRPQVASLRLLLGASSGAAGSYVSATVVNDGTVPLSSGHKVQWQMQQPDGSFVDAPAPGPATLELYSDPPGSSSAFSVWVWPDLVPGVYRAELAAESDAGTPVVAYAPFTVLAP